MTFLQSYPRLFFFSAAAVAVAASIGALTYAQSALADRPSVAEMQAQIDALTYPFDEPSAQVRTALDILPTFTDAVARRYNQAGVPPQNRLVAGLSATPTDTQTSFISAVDIIDGVVVFLFGNDADPTLVGTELRFTPYVSADQTIIWRCGNDSIIPAVALMGGSYQASTIPPATHPDPCITKIYNSGPDLAIAQQVLEPFDVVPSFQAAIETAAAQIGTPESPYAPVDRAEAGLSPSPTDTVGNYFSEVDVVNGAIVVTYGNFANPFLSGQYIYWKPYVSPDGTVTWVCGNSGAPTGTTLMLGAATGYTSVPPVYLPPQCRP